VVETGVKKSSGTPVEWSGVVKSNHISKFGIDNTAAGQPKEWHFPVGIVGLMPALCNIVCCALRFVRTNCSSKQTIII